MRDKKLYDCFCYFNEDMLLELRLETLWDYVDFFVISEANYTHKGDSRSLNFDIGKFDKYKSKIRYQPLKDKPIGPNNFWGNENFIRNNLVNGLWDSNPNDQIMISDLDEIPNPRQISAYNPRFLRGDFLQNYYSYFLNNLWTGNTHKALLSNANAVLWPGTKITTKKHFMNFFKGNATSVRHYKSSGIMRSLKRLWFHKFNTQKIISGGWHFTWVLSIDDILKKMDSTAHTFKNPLYRNKDYLFDMIQSNKDFQDPNKIYTKVKIDSSFPKPIQDNPDKYQKYLR